MKRQWSAQRPFEEAFFLEVLLGANRGLWLRYRIDATASELECWAIATTPEGVRAAHKQCYPLTSMDGIFQCPAARLDAQGTTGELGDIRWDLRFDDRGLRHSHVPWWIRALRIGKTYRPEILDLRVQGEVMVADTRWPVTAGPGVLGHHWGASSRVRRWAWAHCNAFDREDLVFEGLSARIGRVDLTSLVFHADGHAYRFSGARQLISTTSEVHGDRWSFEARDGERVLTGVAALDPETAATVAYPTGGAARSLAHCTNTRFGSLRIVLTDPRRGLDLDVRSRECAFELVTPEARTSPIL